MEKNMAKLAVHPGEILLEEFMKPQNFTEEVVAAGTGLNVSYIRNLISGKARIDSEASLCLGHFFGANPDLWLNLQKMHDKAKSKQ